MTTNFPHPPRHESSSPFLTRRRYLPQGRTTTFVFTLYETGTTTPATIPAGKGIRFSVFDIDRGSNA